MSTVEEIKQTVLELSPTDLAAFQAWFAEFDADVWDRQFEQDAREHRLDSLANEALRDMKEGRCTDL